MCPAVHRPGLFVIAALIASPGAIAQPVEWPVAAGGDGNYYEVVVGSSLISWNDARTAAALRSHLGHAGILASAATAAQDLFVRQLASSTPGAFIGVPSGGASGPWIGGFQPPGSDEPDGGFTWINGDTWNYTNWFRGEPNDGAGDVPHEEAVHLFAPNGPSQVSTMSWNDLFAGDDPFFLVNSYVVEFVIPAPPAAALLAFGTLLAVRRRR